jgi:type I restriction enzyme S subunit
VKAASMQALTNDESLWHTTIGEFCDRFGGTVQTGPFGSQLHASDYSEDGVPVVMPQDMADGEVSCKNIARVSQHHVDRLARHKLRVGDIVFSRRGDVSRFAVVTGREEGWLCGTGSIRIRLNSPEIDTRYLRRFLQQEIIGNWLRHNATGVTMPNLNTGIIRGIPFVYPPLDEQRRIAAILDQADELRHKRREALRLLSRIGSSVVTTVVEGMIAEKQETIKLGDFADIEVGFPFQSEQYVSALGGIRLCRGANVLPGRLDWSDTVYWPAGKADDFEKYKLRPDDVLVAMDRPWISEGFKVARLSLRDVPCLLVQRVARLRPMERGASAFILEILKSPTFAKHCKPTETTVPHISPREIREFVLPRPNKQQLDHVARRLAEIDTLKAHHHAQLAKLDALFASIQHRAFRGEL